MFFWYCFIRNFVCKRGTKLVDNENIYKCLHFSSFWDKGNYFTTQNLFWVFIGLMFSLLFSFVWLATQNIMFGALKPIPFSPTIWLFFAYLCTFWPFFCLAFPFFEKLLLLALEYPLPCHSSSTPDCLNTSEST